MMLFDTIVSFHVRHEVVCFKLGKCLTNCPWKWQSNSLDCVGKLAVKNCSFKLDLIFMQLKTDIINGNIQVDLIFEILVYDKKFDRCSDQKIRRPQNSCEFQQDDPYSNQKIRWLQNSYDIKEFLELDDHRILTKFSNNLIQIL